MMKMHAIQTGTVAVTSAWREGVGHGKRRLLNTIRDREWTEPLPIYAFAIEHRRPAARCGPSRRQRTLGEGLGGGCHDLVVRDVAQMLADVPAVSERVVELAM